MKVTFKTEEKYLKPSDLYLYDTVAHATVDYYGDNINLVIEIKDSEVHFIDLNNLTPEGRWCCDLDSDYDKFLRKECELIVSK